MTFRIFPQEFKVLADKYVIRTRVPQTELTDAMILERAVNANLTVGDEIVIQCMSHEYDELLAEASYRVVKRRDEMVTRELNDRESRTSMDTNMEVERFGEWWLSAAASPTEAEAVVEVSLERERRWNPTTRTHEVLVGDNVVFETKDMALADAVAAGAAVPEEIAA